MKVLIAGGAGYIGSTVASACLDAGISPVIVDSLVTGRREFTAGRAFYEGDIADGPLVDRIFAEHPDIGAVIHCAALIVVPDSVADPVGYYRANVTKSLEFVAHLLRNGCGRLIFSSSAAIYRAGADLTVDEDSSIDPQSPYARTKAVCEAMFADIAASQPIRVLSLRYFNPIGADPKMRTGLQLARPTHALGKMIAGAAGRRPVRDHRDRLADQGRHGAAGLRARVGPGRGARGRADPVRRAARAGHGHQPGHRHRHHGPGTARRVQPGGRPPGRGARGGPTARGRRRRLQPDRPRGAAAGLAAAVRPRRGHQPFPAVGRAPRRDPARLGRPSCAALIWAFPSACSYNEVILMGNQHPRRGRRVRSAARFAGPVLRSQRPGRRWPGVHPGLGSHQRTARSGE